MQSDPTKRFSDRVEDYVKHRPSYPSEVLDTLRAVCGLKSSHLIADIGSGTGISSEIFLKNSNRVYGVEPNEVMRKAAENYLMKYDGFMSVSGTAEATHLPTSCADFVIAAQAFHWFDKDRTKKEFQRILKPDGYVVILFNDRKTSGSRFAEEYEELLLEFGTDYKEVKRRNIDRDTLQGFFDQYKEYCFVNQQTFEFEGLLGRLLSSSYVPRKGAPQFERMVSKLRDIFDRTQTGGQVVMEYSTRVFCSQVKGKIISSGSAFSS